MNTRIPTPLSTRWRALAVAAAAVTLLLAGPQSPQANEFDDELARIDRAIKKNPNRVTEHALEACVSRRRFAIQLYNSGQHARAERRLKRCLELLRLPENPTQSEVAAAGPTMEEIQALAAYELNQAMTLEPNLENGLKIYRDCAMCHRPEGWGLRNGSVPQLAGQHRKVVIKQLADIRAGNRDAILMLPYSSIESIGGAQAVADVAGYIDTLEISVATGKGPGDDLELGERIYTENCAQCHGANGEGDGAAFVPRIHSQHYEYLVRQFEWIRDGKRRNSNPEMAAQIQGFQDRETHAVLDYVSRLEPPAELVAPEGWRNPDFAE